jgi:hypothetical protein
MRRFLLLFSVIGTLAFGAAFVLSFTHPLRVEQAARDLLRLQVERDVGQRIDSLSNHRLVDLAMATAGRTEADIDASRRALRAEVPRRVAEAMADLLDADCDCRRRLVEFANDAAIGGLASLLDTRDKLTVFIESAYAAVSAQLLREFRIFTASNALALALLGVIAFVRRGATLQLVLPAIALTGAMAITGGLYVFNQDWLHTIVFGDYVGFAYAGYLAVVALLLADVLLNRARVTSVLFNAASSAVGSAVTALPC